MSDQLVTAKEAAELLNVSFPTFKKIQKQHGLTGIRIGARIKFSRAEILRIVGSAGIQKPSSDELPPMDFTVFTDNKIHQLEIEKGVFDLRTVKTMDPYGVLSLLCTLISRCKEGQNLELLIEDNKLTQYLRAIDFFRELEAESEGKIGWDKTLLKTVVEFPDADILVPIRGIKLKGNERFIAEKLIDLLKKQGFSAAVGRKIAHIIGELADNALTHSDPILSERSCFILARRFLLNQTNCIIVGLVDTGQGIHTSLKGNPKHKGLSDRGAFLEAFRPYVSSWDDSARRGKGLTDVLTIAWGNKSFLRVDSGKLGLFMDFQNEPSIKFRAPSTSAMGTRYGIVLIDNEFKKRTREEADELIKTTERKVK